MFEDDEQLLCLSRWESRDILVLNIKSKEWVNPPSSTYSNTEQHYAGLHLLRHSQHLQCLNTGSQAQKNGSLSVTQSNGYTTVSFYCRNAFRKQNSKRELKKQTFQKKKAGESGDSQTALHKHIQMLHLTHLSQNVGSKQHQRPKVRTFLPVTEAPWQ